MYQAGWSKQLIDIKPCGYAMHGYGLAQHTATGQRSPLHARALVIKDATGNAVWFCCLDLGYVTWAMREGIVGALKSAVGREFKEECLVLTCTHTHSGPGGCAHEVMYNLVTPGFVPAHVEAIVHAAATALKEAWQNTAPTTLGLAQGHFAEQVPVAWNRSLKSWNRNPDVTHYSFKETHKAVNRQMDMINCRREGQLHAMLSLFGVHATCLGNDLHSYDGDNKGYAARQVEQQLIASGVDDAVAIFAQATAGDISPYYHGPGDYARRKRLKGEAEYAYAEANGKQQSDRALAIAAEGHEKTLTGEVDGILTYIDFTNLKADPRFAAGESAAYTSEPCHGVAFFGGTPVDGRGIAKPLAKILEGLSGVVKRHRLRHLNQYPKEEQDYLRRMYAAQGTKSILMEAGRKRVLGMSLQQLVAPDFLDPVVAEMKRQTAAGAIDKSAMVPTVLPLQIVRIGTLAMVCCPGEFTTTAGRRVIQTVESALRKKGIEEVLICTYCNEYMGYVTTREEYQEQAYEGGHTIFGQWTLAAFQTEFEKLASELCRAPQERCHDRITRPAPVPEIELARRTATTPP